MITQGRGYWGWIDLTLARQLDSDVADGRSLLFAQAPQSWNILLRRRICVTIFQ
jgi:hypothetical protein